MHDNILELLFYHQAAHWPALFTVTPVTPLLSRGWESQGDQGSGRLSEGDRLHPLLSPLQPRPPPEPQVEQLQH